MGSHGIIPVYRIVHLPYKAHGPPLPFGFGRQQLRCSLSYLRLGFRVSPTFRPVLTSPRPFGRTARLVRVRLGLPESRAVHRESH
jgi:hypothetical protein